MFGDQPPNPLLVVLLVIVLVVAASIVFFDEGPGSAALVFVIGGLPMAVYFWARRNPAADDPEVVASLLVGIFKSVAWFGPSARDTARLRDEMARARRRAADRDRRPR